MGSSALAAVCELLTKGGGGPQKPREDEKDAGVGHKLAEFIPI